MSAGGPSKYCPRCDTALPLRAPFCDVCGYELMNPYTSAAPQGTHYGSPYYQGQHAPGSWPQGQPGYSWQGQPGYPYQGPPDLSYPSAPDTAPPRRGIVGKVIVLLLLVIVVSGGAAAWYLYLSPNHSNSPLFDRHGAPGTVPLPNSLTFAAKASYSRTNFTTNVTATEDEWGWKVAGSDPATVAQFYRANMPGKGWTGINSQTMKTGGQEVIGCQATQALIIEAGSGVVQISDDQGNPGPKVTAPAGGSALGIYLISTNNLKFLAGICPGTAG